MCRRCRDTLSLGRSPILGLEVTLLVAERSHGHGMNVLSNRRSTDVEGHAVLTIKPRPGAMLVLRGIA